MTLSSPEECQIFLKKSSPHAIANQLRNDQRACRDGDIPTLLACFVPHAGTKEAERIMDCLVPDTDTHVPGELQRLQYAGVVDGIRGYLANLEHLDTPGPINQAAFEERLNGHGRTSDRLPAERQPSVDENGPIAAPVNNSKIASDLLRDLRSKNVLADTDTLSTILRSLDELPLSSKRNARPPRRAAPGNSKSCYICRFSTTEMHELYSSLCKPCGAFNIAESNLSMPDNLDLTGKMALVTGGRVNLGFHTVLRLLRCGATVIASTRYPQDAEARYRLEEDSASWLDRLSIVGADFRTAKDVFRLVGTTRRLLQSRKLFILVNNAAQTLTDPVQAEQKAIANESKLRQLTINNGQSTVVSNGYNAHVRGGSLMPGGLIEASKVRDEGDILEPFKSYSSMKTEPASNLDVSDTSGQKGSHNLGQSITVQVGSAMKSSWVQHLDEIPYEDIITAHSVNAFVPLILIRELLPLMIDPQPRNNDTSQVSRPPKAHIINVSSREGIFESSRKSGEKPARHVHTNMTKAGLNMITETEAGEAWHSYHIAMNSVDPGFMSAAPEMRRVGESQPLQFEDGAARVLWTVAIAEGQADRKIGPIFKCFLKHFGSQVVNVGLGR